MFTFSFILSSTFNWSCSWNMICPHDIVSILVWNKLPTLFAEVPHRHVSTISTLKLHKFGWDSVWSTKLADYKVTTVLKLLYRVAITQQMQTNGTLRTNLPLLFYYDIAVFVHYCPALIFIHREEVAQWPWPWFLFKYILFIYWSSSLKKYQEKVYLLNKYLIRIYNYCVG